MGVVPRRRTTSGRSVPVTAGAAIHATSPHPRRRTLPLARSHDLRPLVPRSPIPRTPGSTLEPATHRSRRWTKVKIGATRSTRPAHAMRAFARTSPPPRRAPSAICAVERWTAPLASASRIGAPLTATRTPTAWPTPCGSASSRRTCGRAGPCGKSRPGSALRARTVVTESATGACPSEAAAGASRAAAIGANAPGVQVPAGRRRHRMATGGRAVAKPAPAEGIDADRAGDACDTCLAEANPTQAGTDTERPGDACDPAPGLRNHRLEPGRFVARPTAALGGELNVMRAGGGPATGRATLTGPTHMIL